MMVVTPPGAPPVDDDARLAEIMDVILAVAANDFSRQCSVGDGSNVLDGIAAGLNMLAEEIGRQRRLEVEYRAGLLRAERLAAVGTLAAGVAHEINNPAAFLLGNFELLADHVATLRDGDPVAIAAAIDEIEEIAQVGKSGVERIANIVRGLKNFARVEDTEVSEVRLDEIAEQACVLASREIVHRARLIKVLAPVSPIMGERTKLTQVITNLLVNAAQAIDEGNPHLNEVELTTREEDGKIIVRVRDSGRGIPNEVQNRIFQPFFTTKVAGHGTGLGLSISADIARQHRGELTFVSSRRGTTFELALPKNTGWHAPDAPPVSALRPVSRVRVLFIDDEELLLRTYKRLLGKTHDVELAIGGEAGIARLVADRSWDVVVCDLLMPDVDGAGVWDWVGANAPELQERLLFCSGGAFTTRGASFAEEQQHRLLTKPIGRPELEKAIAQVTRKK